MTTVSEQIGRIPSAVRPIVQSARRIVKAVAPDAREVSYQMAHPRSKSMMWKISRYLVDDAPVVGIGTFAHHASLFFYRGADLDDGGGVLEGGGKQFRGIRLSTRADVERPAVKRVLRRAFRLAARGQSSHRREKGDRPLGRRGASAAPSAREVERYLSKLSPEARATLEKVRDSIRAAAPNAVDSMSYGAPAVRYEGRPLAGYAASKDHCSFFVFSSSIIAAHRGDLEKYDTTKGMVRFPFGRPLPAALIRKLIRARVTEIGGGATH